MMTMRISARAIGWRMAATAVYAAACNLAGDWSWITADEQARFGSVLMAGSAVASFIGSVLCYRIAREYEKRSWVRVAWILLAAGLLAMLRSFATLGLGFSASRADYLLPMAVVAMTPIVLWFRNELADAQSSYLLVRYLQYLNRVLMAAPAAVSVPLYRMSRQMGGGRLATSLHILMLSIMLRTVLHVRIVPALAAFPLVATLHSVLSPNTSWLFALAVVYRWELTVDALQATAPSLEETPTRA